MHKKMKTFLLNSSKEKKDGTCNSNLYAYTFSS